ncbi:hypothetical protein EAF00_007853 [Botryotinia globosa]|nr:hypothetical protein EAF00_007853 [Botryotinia globosa]
MVSTKIILWTGMLLATAFGTATMYGFLSNSHYKVLRCLRFPAAIFFPTIIYFNMEALMEFMMNIWTFYQNISQHFNIKKVVEFLKELPLTFWIIATFMTWVWMFSSMVTTLSNGYFQQNDSSKYLSKHTFRQSSPASKHASRQSSPAPKDASRQSLPASKDASRQSLPASKHASR